MALTADISLFHHSWSSASTDTWSIGSASCSDDVLLQDVAIAYGYNNVGLSVPATVTVGKELPLNQLVELLRVECAMCGFTEILTWALCSRSENFEYLRRQDDGNTAVSIGNPATAEFEVCRTSLLQGMPLGSASHTCCLQLCMKASAGVVLIVSV